MMPARDLYLMDRRTSYYAFSLIGRLALIGMMLEYDTTSGRRMASAQFVNGEEITREEYNRLKKILENQSTTGE